MSLSTTGRRSSSARSIVTLTAVFAAALTLTGCTVAPERRGGTSSSAEPSPSGTTPTTPALPLDAYLFSPAQIERVSQAYQKLLNQCTQRFGLSVPRQAPGTPPTGTANERRYGIIDQAQAAMYGYHLSTPDPQPSQSSRSVLEPDLYAVLSGTGADRVHGRPIPAGGCYAEARHKLSPGAPAVDIYLAQRLNQDSFANSQQDAKVQAAIKQWRQCMQKAGHSYPGPIAAAADPRFAGAVSADEITTANTDIICKQRTHLVQIWHTAEADLQRPLIAEHRAELDKIRISNDIQLRVADTLGIPRTS